MKPTARITAALIMLTLLTGCTQSTDELNIPSVGESIDDPVTTVGDSDKIVPDNFDPETYEGLRNLIIDEFHLMLEDIDLSADRGYTHETFTELRAILTDLTENVVKVTTEPAYNSMFRGAKEIGAYNSMDYLERLFTEYPDKIVENPELVQYLDLITKYRQEENFTCNIADVLYDILFPNVSEPVIQKNADGTNTISMMDYDGKLLIYYGKTDRSKYVYSDSKNVILDQPVTLRKNYSGSVTIMPMSEHGTIGKPMVVTVEGLQSDKPVNVNGDYIHVGKLDNDILEKFQKANAMPDISHAIESIRANPSTSQLKINNCSLTSIASLVSIVNEDRIEVLDLRSNNLNGKLDLSAFTELNTLIVTDNPNLSEVILPKNDGYFNSINLSGTSVKSIDFTENISVINNLSIDDTKITDISSLIGIHIGNLYFDPDKIDLAQLENLNVVGLYVRGDYEDWDNKIRPLAKANGTTVRIVYDGKSVQIKAD